MGKIGRGSQMGTWHQDGLPDRLECDFDFDWE
jgi:hypothetical protein